MDYVPARDDHPSVLQNAHTWADPVHVPEAVLAARKVWKDGALVPMAEAGIRFDHAKPCNPYTHNGHDGRGLLGKWGVNHAADPLVTRSPAPNTHQVLVVYRADQAGMVPALPGGMVDLLPSGEPETFTRTCQRELCEEAVDEGAAAAAEAVKEALANGKVVYTGVVHDPRNTKHAWIETCVVHAHLDESVAAALKLREANEEAKGVAWLDVNEGTLRALYANHGAFVREAVQVP